MQVMNPTGERAAAIRAMHQQLCSHEWGPWKSGMTMSLSEILEDTSNEALADDRRILKELGVERLPGFRISPDDDPSFEHHVCLRCGKCETRVNSSDLAYPSRTETRS